MPRPVLVGGAAVELYSASAIATDDFDISTARQEEFEAELRAASFVRPSGRGKATRGWIHRDLRLGFEVVSGALLDGKAERERVRLIDLGQDGEAAIISVEDMIADRMANTPPAPRPKCSNRRAASLRFMPTPISTIWIAVSDMKPKANMASRTLPSEKAIPLAVFAADIERRRRETGITDLPRNAGNRRTPSKRALLKAIEDAGGTW